MYILIGRVSRNNLIRLISYRSNYIRADCTRVSDFHDIRIDILDKLLLLRLIRVNRKLADPQ